jgi:3-hydroxy-3-methylglutaryl CoA synthase
MIGDCGSASSLLGLIAVLDQAKKGDRIFLASYGFGAGSDALSLEATAALEAKRAKVPLSAHLYDKKTMVDYATACRLEYKYMQDTSPLYV